MTQSTIRQLALLLPVISTFAACGGGGDEQPKTSNWVGKTFVLAIPDENWSSPDGIGPEFGPYVPQFLIGIEKGTDDNNLKVTIASAPSGTQDSCTRTSEIQISGQGYPNSEIVVPELQLRITNPKSTVKEVKALAHNVTFKNVLPGDSGVTEDGTYAATIDFSELYPLFNLLPDAERTKEGVCAQVQSMGDSCKQCPDTNESYCITLEAIDLGATKSETAIKKVSEGDIPSSCP